LILLIAPSSAEERSVAAGGFYHSRFKWIIGFLGFVRTARNEAGQAGDDCYQFQGFYRLRNMHLISGSKRFHAVVNSGQCGQSDCRNTAMPFAADGANEVAREVLEGREGGRSSSPAAAVIHSASHQTGLRSRLQHLMDRINERFISTAGKSFLS